VAWERLALEFDCVISVREVLLRLFCHFPDGFDPFKKLGAVTRVFGVSGIICFNGFVMPLFPFQCDLSVAGQIAGKIVTASESNGVNDGASDHHPDTSNLHI